MTQPLSPVIPTTTASAPTPGNTQGTGTTTDGTGGTDPGSGSLLNPMQFLQLLVAQLANQDPLNPMNTSDFVSQMATLDQVTAMQQIQTSISDLVTTEDTGEAVNLIGRQVTVTPQAGQAAVTGLVTGVTSGQSGAEILIAGVSYPLSQVTAVTAGSGS